MTQAYLGHFTHLSEASESANWLSPVRRAAIERFHALGFPTTRNEDWHFTSVTPIAETTWRPSPEAEPVGHLAIEPHLFGHPDWSHAVFVNGRYMPGLSRLSGLPAGVRVVSLAQGMDDERELLESYLGSLARSEADSFTALNTAFFRDGALIHLAADAVMTAPLHILHLTDRSAVDAATHPRTLVVTERHAQATIIESFVSVGQERYFTNAVTEIRLAEGARVDHYKIQRESTSAYHVGTVQAHQDRDSRFASFSFAVGAALSRTNVYTTLAGEAGEAWLDGLYMVDGTQHVDHQTRIEHIAPNCTSWEVYKGVLDGSSHGVFNGKVYVHPEAQKTDGKQNNANLLLSPNAQMDMKPQLEIFADDVKCTHGATIGRLDERALFYMKSRGIRAELAQTLLTYAFAAEVLERIELDPLREQLEAAVLRRVAGQVAA